MLICDQQIGLAMQSRIYPPQVITLPSSESALENGATIVRQSFSAPSDVTVISPLVDERLDAPPKDKERQAIVERSAIVLQPTFKWLLIGVFALTVFCVIAEVILAAIWTDPTQLQTQVVNSIDTGWKGGLGALLGLLAGKLT
jgi:hypothetical protein